MKQYAPRLRGKLVVWLVYYGNDLLDNLSPDMRGYRAPFVRANGSPEGWEIVTHHVNSSRWPIAAKSKLDGHNYHGKLAELCTRCFFSQRAFSACEFLIGKGRDLCETAGATLVVVSIPDTTQLTKAGLEHLRSQNRGVGPIDPDYPDAMLESICRKLNVPFLAGKAKMDRSDFKRGDCHWNKKGNLRMAQLIEQLYQTHMRTKPRERTVAA